LAAKITKNGETECFLPLFYVLMGLCRKKTLYFLAGKKRSRIFVFQRTDKSEEQT
jgi:hypothetical protein